MDQAKRLKFERDRFHGVLDRRDAVVERRASITANIIILTVCGAIGGYLWYLAMQLDVSGHLPIRSTASRRREGAVRMLLIAAIFANVRRPYRIYAASHSPAD